MSKNIIFHNPRCSKSRQTLQLIQEKGKDIEVVEYLNFVPSKSTLKFICEKLSIKPTQLIRSKEKIFTDLHLNLDDKKTDNQWIQILHDNPTLIERPIVIYNNKASIGRPPENVLKILD